MKYQLLGACAAALCCTAPVFAQGLTRVEVLGLQQQLRDDGCGISHITGRVDATTRSAVKKCASKYGDATDPKSMLAAMNIGFGDNIPVPTLAAARAAGEGGSMSAGGTSGLTNDSSNTMQRDSTTMLRGNTMLHDSTTTLRDSTMQRDNTVLHGMRDSTVMRDSTMLRDTTMLHNDMMMRDSAIMRDSTMRRDSILSQTNKILRDSATRADTTMKRDTTIRRDSTVQRDSTPNKH